MDETRLKNALDELLRLAAKTDTRLTAIEADLAELESTTTGMVTKKELAEITHAIMHYAKNVEGMLNAFAKTSPSHEEDLDDLRQRVAAIEKRNPPQAA